VSYAVNYNGVPIPSPDTRADLTKPVIYWTPIIAPGNLVFYNGRVPPAVGGLRLMSGNATQTLSRITSTARAAQPGGTLGPSHSRRRGRWMRALDARDSPTAGFPRHPEISLLISPAVASGRAAKPFDLLHKSATCRRTCGRPLARARRADIGSPAVVVGCASTQADAPSPE
jgi:hypothetical protein